MFLFSVISSSKVAVPSACFVPQTMPLGKLNILALEQALQCCQPLLTGIPYGSLHVERENVYHVSL
jgi:hypothetical protein